MSGQVSSDASSEEEALRPSRRAVVGAAAWSAPAILIATSAPAYAGQVSGFELTKIAPVPDPSADQNTTSIPFTVELNSDPGGLPVPGQTITFSVSGNPDWLTFNQSSQVTGLDGRATATLNFGTPKPTTSMTYTILASHGASGAQVAWTLTYVPAATPVTLFSNSLDGVGSGLPAGFTVRTGATTTAVGTAAAFTTAHTNWESTTGRFSNYASGDIGASSTSAQQMAASDRVPGVRQSGSFGEPGAAFVVQVDTTGVQNVSMSFKAQSLDASSPRTTTWTVDAFVGTTRVLSGTTFTTGGSSFSNNVVSATFPAALNNAGEVLLRIAALTASTGSGNRPTTAIDDLTVTAEAIT